MKLLVIPKERNNPYQSLLYNPLGQHGVQVIYLCELTRSRTLNQLLLPLELLVRRLSGARIVHLHWTYAFTIYGAKYVPFLRWVAQAWFEVWLLTLRLLRMRLVWTAHNVVPMRRILANDLEARERLVAAADLVIAHSHSALATLASAGLVPKRSVVIPHGPYEVTSELRTMRVPGNGPGHRRFLFFGVVKPYKGVDNLLAAYTMLPDELDVHLAVVGDCSDPKLAEELKELACHSHHPVEIRFERIPEEKVSDLIGDTDVVVLPYRVSTTSGSSMLALSHGRPLVVPDLPSMAELPDDAVVRYDGSIEDLRSVLASLAEADADILVKMSAAAHRYCAGINWNTIAQRTFDEMLLLNEVISPKQNRTLDL